MIVHLLSPSIESVLFSADRLPEVVHGIVLQEVMTPFVSSTSMAPAIQTGDRLELEDATDFRIGDVVVYRLGQFFICHRIHNIEGRRIFLRGDATSGPLEGVDLHDVVGRVKSVLRDGNRLTVHYPGSSHRATATHLAWIPAWTWSLQRARSLIKRLMNWIAGVPGIKHIFRVILRRLMTITIMDRASLQSLDGYMSRCHIHLDQLKRYVLPSTGGETLLVIHVGPVYLGICTLDPWRVEFRPLLRRVATALFLEAMESCRPTHLSHDLIRPSTTATGNQ